MLNLDSSINILVQIQDAMCELLSKLRKGENNTISLYQIYITNLSEHIIGGNRLNLFKYITIGFNNSLQKISDFLASISKCLLVLIGIIYSYLFNFQLIFGMANIFSLSFAQLCRTLNDQGDRNLGS